MVSARADATYCESADAVGTTHIELFAVRGYRCITVGEESAQSYTGSNLIILVHIPQMAEFRIQFHKLRERDVQQTFVLFVERLTESTCRITLPFARY